MSFIDLTGEIGENICTMPGKSGYQQFTALHNHFPTLSTKTQAILLTSYVKLVNLYPDTQDIIFDVFRKYSRSNQLELQQRSCEYIVLPKVKGGRDIMENVLETMPQYSEEKGVNSLYALLKKDKEKKEDEADDDGEESSATKPISAATANVKMVAAPSMKSKEVIVSCNLVDYSVD